ncbi:MAG: hypothetical protein ABSA93_33375 [Streptosporangiaceae bacterium]|jgi:hypothetical protein
MLLLINSRYPTAGPYVSALLATAFICYGVAANSSIMLFMGVTSLAFAIIRTVGRRFRTAKAN